MKKVRYTLAFLVSILLGCKGQRPEPTTTSGGTTTVSYIADLAGIFPNPERGWHNRRDIVRDRNFSDIKTAGITLIHSYLRLDNYRDTDIIPKIYLDSIQEGLNAVRSSGLKIILRPTHVWSESPTVPESRILRHIEQINAVLSANADVISHLEAGYLGKWGEWHSGLYTELSNRNDGEIRYKIIKRILETTPNTLPIVMRYPMHIREIIDELSATSISGPLTQVQRDRIGHHNDCFLFDNSDRGTYSRNNLWFGNQSLDQQKQYAFNMNTSFGGNKMVGGETCSPAIDRIAETQNEMTAANWTEINFDFWGDAINMWKKIWLPLSNNDPAEWEFDRISRKLGYRLRLIDASFPTSATPGGSFTFAANLNNDGYAGVVKPRSIYLVFENEANRYNIELANIDIRKWVSGSSAINLQTVNLPSNIIVGSYKLALWMPDASPNLKSQSSYSIRLANFDMWDSKKGYNLLSASVNIK
jgi:hypothetical protein